MARGRLFAAALLAILVGLAPAAAGMLERSQPGHLPPVPPGGYDLPLSPPVTPFPLPPQWVTIRADMEWRKAGKINPKLSEACVARSFRERMPMRFRAVFKTDVLGVAFGHGLNLHDPKGLAERGMIYLFRNGDSTSCVVVAMTNQDAELIRQMNEGAEGARQGGG